MFKNENMEKKLEFIAIRKGNKPGIYFRMENWESHLKGFKNPVYKWFNTLEEARVYFVGSKKKLKRLLK